MIEAAFDVAFIARLAAREKQIQQSYRPVIGVHKWFARRPGSLFRGLLLSEFVTGRLDRTYFDGQDLSGRTILDPFMGGGTTMFESNRVGCDVIGCDVNPMAWWIVRQELQDLDRTAFRSAADAVARDVERRVRPLYRTQCLRCNQDADVKYFLWVKTASCGECGDDVDLFPGYRVAEAKRHPRSVLHCPGCRRLVEISALPARGEPVRCPDCATRFDWARGPARRNRYRCGCGAEGRYPDDVTRSGQPRHRLYGIEYHCADCRQATPGRLFKTPDDDDRDRVRRASNRLARAHDLDLPGASIPDGDETRRLHRWGYQRWRDLFSPRQQLALGLLRQRIAEVDDTASRHALATVFSDALRYQNLLCRYDTYALKCQDVFAVHGFPVAPLACENNVLGIPGIGSGGFRHFVQKYERAKAWCAAPTETRVEGGRREKIPMPGERIAARLTRSRHKLGRRDAALKLGPVEAARLRPATVDAVFTDPPYFDNLQYAELMDFCWVWLRPLIADALPARTSPDTTRTPGELTGNTHLGKGLPHFTDGLARTFGAAAAALRPGGPFAFTWHHNDPDAYLAIIVGVLDAGLHCTATLPAPGEMTASLHIQGTRSATVDTVFVCRHTPPTRSLRVGPATLARWIDSDVRDLRRAGLRVTDGDRHCLTLGHLARVTIQRLRGGWNAEAPVAQRLASAREVFERERHASGGALP